MVKPCGLWSRPLAPCESRRAAELAAPDHQRRSSRPRAFRSVSSAAAGWSVCSPHERWFVSMSLWPSQGTSSTLPSPPMPCRRRSARSARRARPAAGRSGTAGRRSRTRVVEAVQLVRRRPAPWRGRAPRARPSASGRPARTTRCGPPGRPASAGRGVLLVELPEQVELRPLLAVAVPGVAGQVVDRLLAAGVERQRLVGLGQEAGRPVLVVAARPGVVHDHERRQVLVLEPRP